ncbi:MAG: TM2 domain-containing protein [Bacteroidota bacterium]
MRKILLLTLIFAITAVFAEQTEASKYKLNDQKVDQLFETATSVDLNLLEEASPNGPNSTTAVMEEKDPMVAILLDFFVGYLGVHRFYLGTKTFTGIGYILTCGGIGGLVPLIDLIVLAINYDDISEYVDNPKFFMW